MLEKLKKNINAKHNVKMCVCLYVCKLGVNGFIVRFCILKKMIVTIRCLSKVIRGYITEGRLSSLVLGLFSKLKGLNSFYCTFKNKQIRSLG